MRLIGILLERMIVVPDSIHLMMNQMVLTEFSEPFVFDKSGVHKKAVREVFQMGCDQYCPYRRNQQLNQKSDDNGRRRVEVMGERERCQQRSRQRYSDCG